MKTDLVALILVLIAVNCRAVALARQPALLFFAQNSFILHAEFIILNAELRTLSQKNVPEIQINSKKFKVAEDSLQVGHTSVWSYRR